MAEKGPVFFGFVENNMPKLLMKNYHFEKVMIAKDNNVHNYAAKFFG
jgi:hypothetical protein